jgi:ribonuclease BN (tRNA processing enzyme)
MMKTQSLIYSGDIGNENDLYLFNQKVDWFITETTHIKKENILILLEKSDPTEIILTHIGDDFEKPLFQFHQSLPNHIKSRIIQAFDGFEIKSISLRLPLINSSFVLYLAHKFYKMADKIFTTK